MSIIRVTSKLLTIMPRVQVKNNVFHAETPLHIAALLFFTFMRQVTIDRENKYVEVHTRRFWFFTSVTFVPFKRIKCLYYEYKELPTSGVILPRFAMATDSVENYRIGLVLNKPDGERVPLFSIVGEGAKMTGVFGILMGDSPVDFQGEQQKQSLNLVEFLCQFIGVPLGDHFRGTLSNGGAFQDGKKDD